MRNILVAVWLLEVRTASADQCAVNKPDQAQAAAKALTNTAVILFCQRCGDPRPSQPSKVVAHKVIPHDGRVNVESKDVDLAYVYAQTGPQTFTNVGLMVGCGARDVEPFLDFGGAPSSDLAVQLAELGKRVDRAIDDVARAQNDADRAAAKAKLESLRKEKAGLDARAAAERDAAARREREQGKTIRKECVDNPLAKGCP